MKLRKGWFVVWPDGTKWFGDCPKWASGPLMPGATLQPIRIMGVKPAACPGCVHGSH